MKPKEFECPNCGEWLEIEEYAVVIDCPICNEALTVEVDAEFIDGIWHDKTRLIIAVNAGAGSI